MSTCIAVIGHCLSFEDRDYLFPLLLLVALFQTFFVTSGMSMILLLDT
jgi:hypothetical protein